MDLDTYSRVDKRYMLIFMEIANKLFAAEAYVRKSEIKGRAFEEPSISMILR